jgi:DNA-binding response OmpR family regulator
MTDKNNKNNPANQTNKNIVIVGNDIKFARMLEIELDGGGYKCKSFYISDKSGENRKYLCSDALNYCFENDCGFVILAIGETGSGYIEFVKHSKKFPGINIIFVSFDKIINDFKSKIIGKDYGNNNIVFIRRPFIVEKFLKEIADFQKKISKMKIMHPKIIQIGDLIIDETAKTAAYSENKIELTKKGYDLLVFLAKNKGEALERKKIFEQVWGYDYYGSTNVVDVFVKYLRDKIDQKYNIKFIHTVRGTGYMIR